jgi:hypothetical protein
LSGVQVVVTVAVSAPMTPTSQPLTTFWTSLEEAIEPLELPWTIA